MNLFNPHNDCKQERNRKNEIHAFYTKHGDVVFNIDMKYLSKFVTIYTTEKNNDITASLSFSCSSQKSNAFIVIQF